MHRATLLPALGFVFVIASCGGTETGSGTSAAGGTVNTGGNGGAGAGDATGGSGGATTSESNGGSGGATGGGGNGGSTTTVTGTDCTPGEQEACYTGAANTQDVGICKSGTRSCKATGTWGLCIGEVTPLSETCETAGDDDCDGMVNESGTGCVCVPGSEGECYSGPGGTKGVGNCVAGTAICADDGLGYGNCTGQVLPTPENCLAASDENCDGAAPACTGTDAFHKRFGDTTAQSAVGVAAWNGGAVIAGNFNGSVDFGGGVLTSAGGTDVFLASYDYLGAHAWSKQLGDAVAQSAGGVAVDPGGNVYVTGTFAGKIDLGGGMLTSAGGNDLFLAKYDAGGTFLWGKAFGNNKAQTAAGVAVDAKGNVAITGAFVADMVFGANLLVGPVAGNDAFVAVFDTTGESLWCKAFGDAVGVQSGKAVAFGPQGEVILVGDNAGTVDLGGGALVSAGANDVFLGAFEATGTPLWSAQFGDVAAQVANAVTTDSVGNVVLATSFAGKINFGGGALTSAGGNDIGLAKFTSAGMLLWQKRLGGTGADNARGVAIDPFGAISLAGDFAASVDFGGGILASAGGTDVVVAKYDALGAHVWSRKAGDNGAQTASAVGADASGTVVAGTFAGTIDFGGGAQTSAGATDAFLVKLSP